MENEVYYVRRKGRVQGPWDFGRLQSEVELKMLSAFHEVSLDGDAWIPARDLAGLFPREEKRKVLNRGTPQYTAPTVQIDLNSVGNGEWYYCADQNQVGPMTKSDLVEAVLSGRCPLDALAWKEQFGDDWLPIEQVSELMQSIDAPRPGRAGDSAGHTAYVELTPHSTPKALYAIVAGAIAVLFSWIPLVGFGGIVPIALGGYAVYEIRKSNGRISGMGQAIGGIVLGLASIVIAVLVLTGVVVAVWMSS